MPDDIELVRLPAFSAKKVNATFSAIMRVLGEEGPLPTAQSIAAAMGLGDANLAVYAVQASMADVEKTPSLSVRRRFAYRLAANRDRIARGWPCPYGDIETRTYTAAVITGIELTLDKLGQRDYYRIAFRLLRGRSAGMQVIDRCSRAGARAIYMSITGWPRRCYPHSDVNLVGLDCAVLLERDMDNIRVAKIRVTRSQLQANAKLLRSRYRHNAECPYLLGVDCHVCSVGVTECYRSTQFIETNLF